MIRDLVTKNDALAAKNDTLAAKNDDLIKGREELVMKVGRLEGELFRIDQLFANDDERKLRRSSSDLL
jgi:hypothetical protein